MYLPLPVFVHFAFSVDQLSHVGLVAKASGNLYMIFHYVVSSRRLSSEPFFPSIFRRILRRLISPHPIVSLSIVSRHFSSYFISAFSYLGASHSIISHHVSSCLIILHDVISRHIMSHHVLPCLIRSHHVPSDLIMSHHVSLCLIRPHQISSCLIMSHQGSSDLIMSHHVSVCLIMFHHVPLCFAMFPHSSSQGISCFRISSYFCGLAFSHPFNRIPSHRIISYLLPSHHLLPSFSTVIPLLRPSEKPLPLCIAFVHPPGPSSWFDHSTENIADLAVASYWLWPARCCACFLAGF